MPDSSHSEIASMVDRRAGLLADRGRDDPGVAELTAALRAQLGSEHRVRCLRPADSAQDRSLAELLVAREPVNPACDERERARRFATDRRVTVVEHPRLPGRPLNVLWVALCTGCPASLEEVLDPGAAEVDPSQADTAVFYSIWNAEPGLAGLGRGRELIDGTAGLLRAELPQLATLTTMSPVPGFRNWYESQPERGQTAEPSDRDALLERCARYLTSQGDDGRLLDPVTRFHMGNGARLWRLLPAADSSERGMQRSFGIMVNYRYFPENLEANRNALAKGEPALGSSVAARLRA